MGFYENHILPRLIDVALGTAAVGVERERCLTGVAGSVIEIGFGTGHNLPYYPPGIDRLLAVDPSGPSANLAKKRIAKVSFPVDFVPLSGESLASPNSTFDSAVSTFSLCTIPHPMAALREVYRVLKPGGRFFFLEHGLAEEPAVQRWQHRLNGLQQRICGGCHLNREIGRLVTQSGFTIEKLDCHYGEKGPRPLSYLYCGVAWRAP